MTTCSLGKNIGEFASHPSNGSTRPSRTSLTGDNCASPVALKLRRDSVGKRRRQKTSLIL